MKTSGAAKKKYFSFFGTEVKPWKNSEWKKTLRIMLVKKVFCNIFWAKNLMLQHF